MRLVSVARRLDVGYSDAPLHSVFILTAEACLSALTVRSSRLYHVAVELVIRNEFPVPGLRDVFLVCHDLNCLVKKLCFATLSQSNLNYAGPYSSQLY